MTASTCPYCGLGLGPDAELLEHIESRHGISLLQHVDNQLRANPDGTTVEPSVQGELIIPKSDDPPPPGGYL